MNLHNLKIFFLSFFIIFSCGCGNKAFFKETSPIVKIQPLSLKQLSEAFPQAKNLTFFSHVNLYYAEFEGFPKSKKMKMVIERPIVGSKKVHPLDLSNEAVLLIDSRGFLPGEKVLLKIQNEDESICYETSLVPEPALSNSAKQKFSIEAKLIDASKNCYELKIHGLGENQPYHLRLKSDEEELNQKLNSSERTAIILLLGIIGKTEGIAEITISTQEDVATLKLPWGDYLTKINRGKFSYQELINQLNNFL